MNLFKREPVLVSLIAAMLAGQAAKYGFAIEEGTISTLMESLAVVIAALFARAQVTPTSKVNR